MIIVGTSSYLRGACRRRSAYVFVRQCRCGARIVEAQGREPASEGLPYSADSCICCNQRLYGNRGCQ